MKKLELSWEELQPAANILNEVCHGIEIDIQAKIGYSYEEQYALLKKRSLSNLEDLTSQPQAIRLLIYKKTAREANQGASISQIKGHSLKNCPIP